MDTFRRFPVIVVGGGLAGLSAAALLGRAGLEVTVLEKASIVGGRARTKDRGGFLFNQGAHAFYLGGPGERLMAELGVRYSGSAPRFRSALALEDRKMHMLPAGAASLLGTRLLSLAAKREFVRFFRSLKGMNLVGLERVSFQEWLEQEVRSLRLRSLILAIARTTTNADMPDLISASLVIPLLSARVYYLDGGWQTLVDGLRQKVEEAGGQVVTQARVVAVVAEGERWRVRLSDGISYEAAAVVMATDPGTASALVADGRHDELNRWAEQAIPARIACYDIALRRLPRPEHRFALGMNRPLYYSVHSTAASLAPEGKILLHAMRYLRPDERAEPEEARRELEELMDLVQPGWREEVMEASFLPHMIASHAIVQARLGGLTERPGPVVPGLPNLYVAGDWVGPEGQLAEACFASARSAASMIVEIYERYRAGAGVSRV